MKRARASWAATAMLLAASGVFVGVAGVRAQTITEFTSEDVSYPEGIVAGPGGYLWFASGGNAIARMSTGGKVRLFPILTPFPGAHSVAVGPDGNIWFTEKTAHKIGRLEPSSGTITDFPVLSASAFPDGIAAGPDGNLWFTESGANRIGRITTAGEITEFPIPTSSAKARGIALGPDGNLWFAESGSNANGIGRITPAGVITEFPAPTDSARPEQIAAGPDGALWFTEPPATIGRITPSGSITEFHCLPRRPPGQDHGRSRRRSLVHRTFPSGRSAGSRRAAL